MKAARPLEGRTAVITGAARGLGRALSEALCQAGARVMLIDMRGDAVEQASRELNER
ncbi:SDR family NAD(P)-dependent oxidoreductase, partial [Acinetobacter baumannii]